MTKKAQNPTKTKLFDIFMKITMFLIFVFFLMLLCGCAREKPTYETVADNAVDIITAIEQGLPTECKTDTNKLLFNVGRKEISNVKTACDERVDKITRDKLRWKLSFWALIGVIAAYIAKKILG